MNRPFAALVWKDLRLFFMDRRAVVFSIVAPIAIASFFGFVFGNGHDERASRMMLLVADQDRSAISTALVARLAGDPALAVTNAAEPDAREAVRRGKAPVAIVLPAGFGTAAAGAFFGGAGQPKASIALLYDPSHATEAAMVEGILAGRAMETVSREMFTGQSGRDAVGRSLADVERSDAIAPEQKAALLQLLRGVQRWNDAAPATRQDGAGGLTIPYELHKHAVTSAAGTAYNGYAHAFAGMGVQFILFMAIEMGVGLLLQRQQGLWRRLRAAPLSRGVVLGSRVVSTALLSLSILFCIYLFARVVFGVRIEGSLPGFLLTCVSFSLMTAAFGLLIASLGKTPESTRGLAVMATLFLLMLGGAWIPTFVFPAWLQRLTLVVPTRWAVDALDATTWRGLGFSAVAWPILLLLLAAVACGAVAVARFRWDAE